MNIIRKIKYRNILRILVERSQTFSRFLGKTTKHILFLINVLFIILLYLSISAWYIPPYDYIFTAYLGLGFIVIFAVCVGFLLFWLVLLKKKPIFLNIIALLICWNPISTYFPINFKSKDVPEGCIKIMTYNVKGFNWDRDESARDKPIFEYMANSNADIICMQEFVINNHQYNREGVISIREIDQILKDYPYRSILRFGKAEGEYSFGIACYSKFPILKTEEIPINSELSGGAVHDIKINDKIIKLFNVHLESNKLTSEDKQLYWDFIGAKNSESFDKVFQNINGKLGKAYVQRAIQADLISDWISKEDSTHTIVCGDFNDTPMSYVYKKVRGSNLYDSFAETGMGQGITFNEHMFWFRIDYIMHSGNMKAYNSSIDKVMYSDHYPLTTYLQIDPS